MNSKWSKYSYYSWWWRLFIYTISEWVQHTIPLQQVSITWCVGYSSRAFSNCDFNRKTCVDLYVLMNSSWRIQWEVFQPVTKTENLRMPSIIEDDIVPVSHAVDHLELLYNNTTKQYKNTGLPHTVEPSVLTLFISM